MAGQPKKRAKRRAAARANRPKRSEAEAAEAQAKAAAEAAESSPLRDIAPGYRIPKGGIGPGRPPHRVKGFCRGDLRSREEIADAVLDYYREVPNLKLACGHARVGHRTVQDWLEEDSDFARWLQAEFDDLRSTICRKLIMKLMKDDVSNAEVKATELLLRNFSNHEITGAVRQVQHTHDVGGNLAGIIARQRKLRRAEGTPALPPAQKPGAASSRRPRSLDQAEVIDAEISATTPQAEAQGEEAEEQAQAQGQSHGEKARKGRGEEREEGDPNP